MDDRSVRRLDALENSASTSRVLNLRLVAKLKANHPEYKKLPLFENPVLNTSIIVKHRLRANEVEQFGHLRRTATKILIPIDSEELRIGARFIFIGQSQFERALYEGFGIPLDENSRDRRVLNLLDETPTLDPFLLREQLRLRGLEPGICYFELSKADAQNMFEFAQREIAALVGMSVQSSSEADSPVERLTRKILANSADADLDPLRRTLQMEKHQFQDGAFCWKAFLYYKWQLRSLVPKLKPILEQIESIKPHGPATAETKNYLGNARQSLRKSILSACGMVKSTLKIYDDAYLSLTQNHEPSAFRQFLLDAPGLFNELGERLGAIEHIVSFWRFRFPSGKSVIVAPDELADIFREFASSLTTEQTGSRLVA